MEKLIKVLNNTENSFFDFSLHEAKNNKLLCDIIWVNLVGKNDLQLKINRTDAISVNRKILFRNLFGRRNYSWKLLKNKIRKTKQIIGIMVANALPKLMKKPDIFGVHWMRIESMIMICKKRSVKNVKGLSIINMRLLLDNDLVIDRLFYLTKISNKTYDLYMRKKIDTEEYLRFINYLSQDGTNKNITNKQIKRIYEDLYHGKISFTPKLLKNLSKILPLSGYMLLFTYTNLIRFCNKTLFNCTAFLDELRKLYDVNQLSLRDTDNVYSKCNTWYDVEGVTDHIIKYDKPGREKMVKLMKHGIIVIKKYIIFCSMRIYNQERKIITKLVKRAEGNYGIVNVIINFKLTNDNTSFVKEMLKNSRCTANSIKFNTSSLCKLLANKRCTLKNSNIVNIFTIIHHLIKNGAELTKDIIVNAKDKNMLNYTIDEINKIKKEHRPRIYNEIDKVIPITDLANLITNYLSTKFVLKKSK